MDKTKGVFRKSLLTVSIIATIAFLFVFKYFNFFAVNLASLARFLNWNYPLHILNIVLPIGLSFHTFQSLAYVIEVYRKRQKVERNFGIYALYVMFYPQLVAGPIERPQNLLHQFYEKHSFEYNRVISGLRLALWGFFQKIVIADRLAIIVNKVYEDPYSYGGPALIFATILFSFQIFCDFAGYSNIAIGVARVMGFTLMKNFDNPYGAKTVSEFWNKWHISLYSWFRDYLFIPLGGSRVSKVRSIFNILIVFLISGLWHGANWTFVIWGGLNGVYLIIHSLTKSTQEKVVSLIGLTKIKSLYTLAQTCVTFMLISFSWIFFRAKDLTEARYIITHLFSGFSNWTNVLERKLILGTPAWDLIFVFLAIIFMQYVLTLRSKINLQKVFSNKPIIIRWSVYYLILMSILYYMSTTQAQFIYFQF
ncbi:MAG: MBOAT family O-acyltransferase [Patescibacteria group bacterium]